MMINISGKFLYSQSALSGVVEYSVFSLVFDSMWSIASFCVWQQVKYCSFEVEGGGLRVHYAYYGLADSEVGTKKAEQSALQT